MSVLSALAMGLLWAGALLLAVAALVVWMCYSFDRKVDRIKKQNPRKG